MFTLRAAIAASIALLVCAIPASGRAPTDPRPPGTITAFVVRGPAQATDEQIARTAAILTRRFRALLRTPLAEVVPTIRQSRVEIRIRGDAVTPEEARELGTARGVLRVTAVATPSLIWISDLDVTKAIAYPDDRSWNLGIDVRASAASRLKILTATRNGQLIDWTLDGRRVSRARLAGPIPDGRLVLPMENAWQAVMLQILLDHGRLPVDVSGFEILSASPK